MPTDIEVIQLTAELKMRELASSQKFSANWFAAYTHSHHEKRVASHFGERGIESFLPLYSTRRRWKNRCEMNLELPLFPNYVFVHIDPRERVRVLEVPGVQSLVGFGRTPAPLPHFEIEALRAGLGQRGVEPHPYLVIGERVRIKAGPMTGLEGVLVRKKNNFRVVLALDVIMRSVAVEVDADDLEPAANYGSRAIPLSQLSGQYIRSI
jgi:transcription termination/antitermination protein NusG